MLPVAAMPCAVFLPPLRLLGMRCMVGEKEGRGGSAPEGPLEAPGRGARLEREGVEAEVVIAYWFTLFGECLEIH